MRANVPRKFTLFDAMVLIAATGIAFVPVRHFLWHRFDFPDDLSVRAIWFSAFDLNVCLVPLTLSLTATLWVLGMKRPRPSLRRVFRGPGMAACTVTLFYAFFSLVGYATYLYRIDIFNAAQGKLTHKDFVAMWIQLGMRPMCMVGAAIASTWVLMWLSSTFRPDRGWIDRAGRALGIYWVTMSLFFGSELFTIL